MPEKAPKMAQPKRPKTSRRDQSPPTRRLEARLGARGLLALEPLLDAALLGGGRFLLGGCWLSHGTRFLSDLGAWAELRVGSSPADQRGHDPPHPHDERHGKQHEPDRREKEHRRRGEDAKEQRNAEIGRA